ncbi:MAG: beta-lactamase family protein [Acidobacteria bacterium]|nr:beta-lactamase family protein [Acidobacteriota bacterium]
MEPISRRELFRRSTPPVAYALLPLKGCATRDPAASIAPRITSLMAEHSIAGLSLAIVRGASIMWARGFGVRDAASGVAVDEGTMFEAASMSKPVFAYAVMKLCEKGILQLDTPLTRYTSGRFLEGDPRLHFITARHVLSHTSGLPDIRSGSRPLKIHFAPGERWQYSGEGYAYLQSVATSLTGSVLASPCSTYEAGLKVCGTDFDAQMRTNLLSPFGMNLSGYLWTEVFAKHLARPHDTNGKPLPPRHYTSADAARYGSMGGLLTTAADYAKFVIEIMAPKPADTFRLNTASWREMLRPQVKVEDGPGYSISWALGWKIARTAEYGELVSHGGDQTGFHSLAEFSLAAKTGYVILTNGENGWKLIQTLAPELARLVHGRSKT